MLNQIGIDNEACVLSYRTTGNEKERTSIDTPPFQQREASMMDDFVFEIPYGKISDINLVSRPSSWTVSL